MTFGLLPRPKPLISFTALRENLQLMAQAAYVVELLDRFTYEEGQNWQLYKLLVETLERISTETDTFIPVRFYEMRLLDLLGFRPLLFECASCGEEITAQRSIFFRGSGRRALPALCDARSILPSRLAGSAAFLAAYPAQHLQRSQPGSTHPRNTRGNGSPAELLPHLSAGTEVEFPRILEADPKSHLNRQKFRSALSLRV